MKVKRKRRKEGNLFMSAHPFEVLFIEFCKRIA